MEDKKQAYPEHLIHSAGRLAYIIEATLFTLGLAMALSQII